MEAEDFIGKKVTVYDEANDEHRSGEIDDYFPGPSKGYHIQFYDGGDMWYRRLDHNIVVEGVEDDDAALESRDDPDDTLNYSSSLRVLSQNGSRGNTAADELQVLDQMTNNYLTSNTVPPVDGESSLKILTKLGTASSRDAVPALASPRYTPGMVPEGRGVLVGGRLTAVENIPTRTMGTEGTGIFYRVYYQDATNSATAKSNIFNSDVVQSIHFEGGTTSSAVWGKNNNSFPFEMVLPKHITNICMIEGDILLSFFRVRPQGGNDVIGHLRFALRDLANRAPSASGKGERKRRPNNYRSVDVDADESLEVRTIDGTFVVCQKIGSKYKPIPDGAEVKMRLDLVWKQGDFAVEPVGVTESVQKTAAASARSRDGDRSQSPSVSHASSGKSLSRPQSAGSARSKLTGAGREATAKAARATSREKARPKSAGGGGLHAKVNRERQLKIDRENKLMAAKLGKMGTKQKTSAGGGAYSGEVNVPKPQPLYSAAEPRPALKDRYKDNAEKEEARKELAALQATFNALKSEVTALEGGNSEAKAQILKYQSLIKQCGMTTDRIKRQTNLGTASAPNQKHTGHVAQIMNKYVPLEGSSSTGAGAPALSVEMIAKRREEELEELNAVDMDAELKDNLAEHIALQESRRVLVHRIAHAKAFCAQHQKEIDEMHEKAALVEQRLQTDAPTGGVSSSASVTSTRSSQGRSRGSASRQGPAKSAVAKKSKNSLYEEPNEAPPVSYDVQLRHKIRDVSREIKCLEASLDEDSFNLKLDADIDETCAVRTHLQAKMRQLTDQLEALTYTRDQYQTSLSLYSGDEEGDEQGSEILRLKHSINKLRVQLMRHQSQRVDEEMNAKMTDLEMEMIRRNRGQEV